MIFQRGDLVRIAKDLGPSMRHFKNDCDAIIQYSYGIRYGRGTTGKNDDYSVLYEVRKGHWTSCAWYRADQLTLIHKKDTKTRLILGDYQGD